MRSAVKKFGNSAGIIIPKPMLCEFGVEAGDNVELRVEAGKIVIERLVDAPRTGWADDAKRIAAAEDDRLLWPEFANDDDGELVW